MAWSWMRFICLFLVSLLAGRWCVVGGKTRKAAGFGTRRPRCRGFRRWCYVVLVARCRVRRLVVLAIAMNAGTAAGMLAFGRFPLVGSTNALPQRRGSEATRAARHERVTPGQATPRRA